MSWVAATWHRARTVRPTTAAAVVAGLAYAVVLSFTTPFTWAADVATALPLAAAVVVLAARARPARAGPATDTPTPARRWWLVWAGLAAAVAGWELATYLGAPRRQHPTLSSLLDLADTTHVGKGLACALWLALGWRLVHR